MRRDVLLLGALLTSSAAAAQQAPTVDNYSIPSKSRYSQQSYAGKRPLTRAERTNFAVRTDTMFPVFLATATLSVCWTATLWDTTFLSAPTSVWDVQKYGFLGAYAFTSQSLIRRFQRDTHSSA